MTRLLRGRRSSSFAHEALLRVPAERIWSILGDVPRFCRLNPLVVTVAPEPGRPGFYKVEDRLRLLGVPFTFAYRARIERVPDGLDTEAWSPGGVHVRSRWIVTPMDAGCRVREEASIEAPWLLAPIAFENGRKAHAVLLRRLTQAVEG
jgi:hypothetical protein